MVVAEVAAAMSAARVSREAIAGGGTAPVGHAFWETQPVMQFSEPEDQEVRIAYKILLLFINQCGRSITQPVMQFSKSNEQQATGFLQVPFLSTNHSARYITQTVMQFSELEGKRVRAAL